MSFLGEINDLMKYVTSDKVKSIMTNLIFRSHVRVEVDVPAAGGRGGAPRRLPLHQGRGELQPPGLIFEYLNTIMYLQR